MKDTGDREGGREGGREGENYLLDSSPFIFSVAFNFVRF